MGRRDDLAARRAEREGIRDVAKIFARQGWTDAAQIRARAAGSAPAVRDALRKLADEIENLAEGEGSGFSSLRVAYWFTARCWGNSPALSRGPR